MKLLELRRLNFLLAVKVIIAYIGKKVLYTRLIDKQDELIAYFNHLLILDIYHLYAAENYYRVKSPQYGEFYLRKPFSSDYKVFEQVFLDKEYAELAGLCERYIPNDTVTVIDGGANIGFLTIYLNHYLKGNKKIKSILIEPFEDNMKFARLNIRVQRIENVFFELAGLYNKDCFLKIEQGFRDAMEWSVQTVESAEATALRSIEIKDIFQKYDLGTLDLLKLDIEGAEKFLFESERYASGFLEQVNIIAIELHNEYHVRDKILDILKNNDFEISRYGEMHIGIKNHLVHSLVHTKDSGENS